MIPNKFNIVDFGGFDLVAQSGEAVSGIYDRIVGSYWNCVYIMCFGLKFAGFNIAPQYMMPEITEDVIKLSGYISIDRDDVITVNLPPPEPAIIPGIFEENGTFTPPSGFDGFAPVTVNVSGGATILHGSEIPTSDVGDNGQIYLKTNSYGAYIFPSGDVSVNLGYTPNLNSEFYLRIRAKKTRTNNTQYAFGARNAVGSYPTYGLSLRDGGTWRARAIFGASSSTNYAYLNIPYDAISDITLKSGLFSYSSDGASGSTSISGSSNGTVPLRLFTIQEGSTVNTAYSDFDFFRLEIKESGTTVKNYIPFKDSNDVACIKETISNTLLYGEGAGSLSYIAGSDTVEIIEAALLKVNGVWQDLIGSDLNDVDL